MPIIVAVPEDDAGYDANLYTNKANRNEGVGEGITEADHSVLVRRSIDDVKEALPISKTA